MPDNVTLTCSWGRTPLAVTSTPQVNYLLIEAQPLVPPAVAVPLNFCMVLDRSGSMQGAKLAAMKAAAQRVIEMLTPQDVVSLVIFDETASVVLPATQVTNHTALATQVATIEEAGGTAMSQGLIAGQSELQKYASADRLAHMLLLTDGQTWGDEETCRTLAQQLGSAGVRITALGLGTEWNEQLLDDMADLTGGVSDYIADPATIDTFFQRTVREAQGTALRDVRLLLRLVRDATPRAVYRVTPTIANLGYQPIGQSDVAVNLGDLTYGAGSSVVLDVMIQPRTSGSFRVAQTELHYTPVGESSEQVLKQDVLLDFVSNPEEAAYDAYVMNLVEKVTAFKLQTRALAEAEAGNLSGATQKLRAAATRLLDLGELELAEKTQQQADQLDQGEHLSAESQKELRYATRRLTQKLEQ